MPREGDEVYPLSDLERVSQSLTALSLLTRHTCVVNFCLIPAASRVCARPAPTPRRVHVNSRACSRACARAVTRFCAKTCTNLSMRSCELEGLFPGVCSGSDAFVREESAPTSRCVRVNSRACSRACARAVTRLYAKNLHQPLDAFV